MMAFSAGGIAAAILLLTVLVMIIAKLVCVFTGYDKQLNGAILDDEEQKQMLNTIVSGNDVTCDMQAPDCYSSDEQIFDGDLRVH
jgi:hypothetical protein